MSMDYDYSKASLRRRYQPGDVKSNTALPPFHSDSFRVLKLFPGTRDSDLACTLLVRRLRRANTDSLQEATAYDALSYTWGPQHGSNYKIKIVAEDNIYSLQIGKNLDAALRQLRYEDVDRDLWVDAICINQKDKDEKSVQIPLMKDIYNDAACVRIWLGSEADESAKAMEFMKKCTDTELFDEQVKDDNSRPLWAAVSALVRRPWFNRRWIIQEIALARKAVVHCGEKQLGWRDFASVIGMLADAQPQLKTLFRESSTHKNHPDYLGDLNELGAIKLAHLADNLLLKDTDGKIDGRSLSLEALVASLTAFEASEPHDVIYAILWLADDAHPVTKNAYTARGPDASPGTTKAITAIGHSVSRKLSGSSPNHSYDPATSLVKQGNQQDSYRVSKIPAANSSSPASKPRGRPDDRTVPSQVQQGAVGSHQQASLKDNEMSSSQIKTAIEATSTALSRQAISKVNGIASAQNAIVTESASAAHDQQATPKANGTEIPQTRAATETSSAAREQRSVYTRTALHGSPPPSEHHSKYLRLPSIIEVPATEDKEALASILFMTKLEKSRIVVDYGLSAFEVYKNFLDLALRQSSSLDILCIPWAPNDPQLPSWIPQLSKNAFGYNNRGILRRTHADPLVKRPGHSNGGSKPYRASRSLPAVWKFGGPDGRSLEVQGFVLDRINQLGKEAVDAVIPSEWMEAVEWTDQTKAPPEMFWRTLVGNLNTAGDAYAPINWEISCKDAFKRRTNGGPLNTSDILFDCPDNVRKFLERVQRVIWSRRLVLLERHHKTSIALTPAESKEGDLICILHGCSVPVVLREVMDAQPAYNKDSLTCFNCSRQGHGVLQCDKALDRERIESNADKHHINDDANTNTPSSAPAPRDSKRRRGSCPPARTAIPFKKPRRYYQLIGECYVHRMMNGEASRRLGHEATIQNALIQDSVFWRPHDKPIMFELR